MITFQGSVEITPKGIRFVMGAGDGSSGANEIERLVAERFIEVAKEFFHVSVPQALRETLGAELIGSTSLYATGNVAKEMNERARS